MLHDLIKEQIITHLSGLKRTPNGWYSHNCLLCAHRGHGNDRKKRLGVLFSSNGEIGVSCFNCGFKSRYTPGTQMGRSFCWFLSKIGVPEYNVQKFKFESYREQQSADYNAESNIKLIRDVKKSWVPIKLPSNSLSISEWQEYGCNDNDFLVARDYALRRNIKLTDVYWTPTVEYNHRIIIPFYYARRIVGYTARYIHTANKDIPRYINTMPSQFIYNLDNQMTDERKYCIISEGILDAYVIDGISCNGNSISEEQINIIKLLNKEVIVCPDRDNAGQQLVNVAIKQGWKISIPPWGDKIKDVNDASLYYGRLLTVKSIIDYAETNELKIHIARKLSTYNG